jgi:hypothetical protein
MDTRRGEVIGLLGKGMANGPIDLHVMIWAAQLTFWFSDKLLLALGHHSSTDADNRGRRIEKSGKSADS